MRRHEEDPPQPRAAAAGHETRVDPIGIAIAVAVCLIPLLFTRLTYYRTHAKYFMLQTVAVSALICVVRRGRWWVFATPVALAIYGWLGWSWLSVLWSHWPWASIEPLVRDTCFGLAAIAASGLLVNRLTRKVFLVGFGGAALAAAGMNIHAYSRGVEFPFGNPSITAAFLIIPITVTLGYLTHVLRERGAARWGALALLCVLLWCLAGARSQAGFLGVAIGIMLLFLLYYPRARVWALGVVACVILLADAAFLARGGPDRFASSLGVSTTGIRLLLWADTMEMARHRPCLGYGIGSYLIEFARFRSLAYHAHPRAVVITNHCHNQALQIFAELGPLGLLVFALLLFEVARTARRAARADGPSAWLPLALLAGIFGMLAEAEFSIAPYCAGAQTNFWMAIALLIAVRREQDGEGAGVRCQVSGEAESPRRIGRLWPFAALVTVPALAAWWFFAVGELRAQYWLSEGVQRRRAQRYEESAAALRKALGLCYEGTTTLIARPHLAGVLDLQGETDEALKELYAIEALAPDYSTVRRHLGRLESRRGDYEVASRFFVDYCRRNPFDPQAYQSWIQSGCFQADRQSLGTATSLLEQGVAMRPDSFELVYLLGLLYKLDGKHGPARRQFRRAVELCWEAAGTRQMELKKQIAVLETLALASVEINPNVARAACRELLNIDPRNPVARNILSHLPQ